MDENVPRSVWRVFADQGHQIVDATEELLPSAPDGLIARYGDIHAAVVVTWNRRDFRKLSPLVPADNVRRFRRLSWIAFRCTESRGAERARRWMAAIDFHLSLASQRRDSRLMIDITETTFTVIG
jgi:hypothetical protein